MNASTAAPTVVPALHPWDKDDLKRRIRLRDLVEHHGIALRRDGARWKALCPFHDEADPSFTIFATTDTWKCFGCGRGGDIFHFLWHLRGARTTLDAAFLELGDELAVFAGTVAVTSTPPAPSSATHGGNAPPRPEEMRGDAALALALAVRWYQQSLWGADPARAYLRARAIPWWAARDLCLGWAGDDTLAARLARYDDGRLLPAAHDLGLLKRGPGGDRDHLAGRIIVPELRAGRPIWLIGRRLDDAQPDDHQATGRAPKYLALPGPKPVLGLECIADQPEVFLCEGTLDWVTLRAWGYPACCSNGAAALAPAIAAVAGAARVWGVLDEDDAGSVAAERLAGALGDRFRRLPLPTGSDPNALAATVDGRAAFAALLASARQGD